MVSVTRYFQPPQKSYFLFGPRGAGKSTWVKLLYPNAPIIDLLQPDVFRTYKAAPERLKDFVNGHPDSQIFVIDEVQKVPEMLSVVHSLIELKKDYLFVLTGSSARKLKREGVDLLAGRAQLKTLHPFMASEIKEQFNLEQNLQYGLLPLILASKDPVGDLKAYIALYMKEEVQMEGLVRHIEQFARFLEIISFSQASILNYSNIARDCHVNSKTVENYVSILEDLLLSFRIPIFSKKAKRNLSSRPKFYYFDAGVYSFIRPKGPLDKVEEIGAHTFETLIAQNLRAWLDYSIKEGELFFWRTKSGLEVDFVIYGEIGFYAIEVKNSDRIRPSDLKGLKEFQKDYPQSKCVLLYRGNEKLLKDNVLCIPVVEFLLQLVPDDELL